MPTTKSFEQTLPFVPVRTPGGMVTLPIVTVTLIRPSGARVGLPLLFDTGASVTTLRKDLFPLLGLTGWDIGLPVELQTAGGADPVRAYQYTARLELFGKAMDCTVQLADFQTHPLILGLFGRQGLFSEFGFGFWESTSELHATSAP